MIEVRVEVPVVEKLTLEVWETNLYDKLRKAGVPVDPDGTITEGTLVTFNDPSDFGVSVYQWSPPTVNGDSNG